MNQQKLNISMPRHTIWTAWVVLSFLLIGLLYSPYITYSLWRHQHRMHFKSEAAKMYHDRPELFSTFICDAQFKRDIEMLKPGKEFRLEGKKYDIIDTLLVGTEKQWVCIQDEYEMALERLIKEHGHEEQDHKTGHLNQEWCKVFRGAPQSPLAFALTPPADCAAHLPYWSFNYKHPFLAARSKPPQALT